MSGIYLKQGETYVSMTVTPYDSERVLQELIGQHAEVLADETAGQGSLLLVRREAAVSDQEDAGGRWSLDHLYVDAHGVPTLVEVKRSSDTRGRREVVAQMLDYAANAKLSFNAERMATWLEENAQERGTSASQALSDTLGVEDPDAFWATVATNLDAERFRLIFVSDVIPPELAVVRAEGSAAHLPPRHRRRERLSPIRVPLAPRACTNPHAPPRGSLKARRVSVACAVCARLQRRGRRG